MIVFCLLGYRSCSEVIVELCAFCWKPFRHTGYARSEMVFINFQRRRNASVDKGRDDVNDVHITHIQVSVTQDWLCVTDHGDLC